MRSKEVYFYQRWSGKEGKANLIILAYSPTADAILNYVDNSMYSGKTFGLCTIYQMFEQKTTTRNCGQEQTQ